MAEFQNFMLNYIFILHCLQDGLSQTIGCGFLFTG